MIHRTSLLLLAAFLTFDGTVKVSAFPLPPPENAHQINQDAQMRQTMGPVTENGCSKDMEWKAGKPSFDKDQVAERLTVYNNVWSAQSASGDSRQSVKCNSYKDGKINWSTSLAFTSTNPSLNNQVKSYSNVGWAGKPLKISLLNTFSSSWNWSFKAASSDLVADVSYDIFTSLSPTCSGQGGGCASHEIMIWLVAKGGAAPAGAKTGKTVSIGSRFTFDVWKGVVGGIPVISLVPVGGKAYHNFAGDFKPLLQKELTQFGLDPNEFIATVGSGIEPFTGSVTLTSEYSLRLL
ncbi:endoglucanase [Melampsora larici-populina 98AG31]|uniref:Endoglucanase n=1 Tax=Melampsora larici-populina (strain 98AG31 / pathotype 3-4-7) TaxID=747676 RepID=F4RM97_MELLP|nr:endoglucanase [Melampsora larici-populina 98AG31]EGG06506.1 endoglucanase [Melampsora larici-populina 98AG31]